MILLVVTVRCLHQQRRNRPTTFSSPLRNRRAVALRSPSLTEPIQFIRRAKESAQRRYLSRVWLRHKSSMNDAVPTATLHRSPTLRCRPFTARYSLDIIGRLAKHYSRK